MIPWIIGIAFVIAIGGANYFWLRAYDNLSAYGKEHRARVLFWSKFFSGPENFTPAGLRYRNRALICLALWPVTLLLMLLAS